MTHKLYHSCSHISFLKTQRISFISDTAVKWLEMIPGTSTLESALEKTPRRRWTFLCQRWHQAGTPKLVLWRTESARNGWRPTGGKWKVLWPVCHLFPLGNKDMTQLHVVCKRPPPSTSAVTVWRGMDRKGRRKESPHSPESHHSLKQEQLSFHSHCLEHSRRLWLRARCVAGLEMLWTGISWL